MTPTETRAIELLTMAVRHRGKASDARIAHDQRMADAHERRAARYQREGEALYREIGRAAR